MKKLIIAVGMIGILSSCTQTERGTAIGAGSGAIIGGAVSNSWEGAAIGAVAGGVVGALVGHSQEHRGYCIYRDRYGRRFEAPCR
ncbi:putative membrane protein [Pararhizobium capsulatum DSM 1112]|uniref:Membrane protein n=1 Tax=Pararhizobium capsulatum DSM 1112 TaxID=1121113 RepID=A0ABU0C2T4_9HYPH|nr:YMGG-like glycine zipper-containing protein [Pararhizobium capsulatum]MDQ0323990.1 putative membrane protein [Pararhizobium capsulatum DSM 1112]MDQ0324050.1 putative membrane protein [Pararhizobium capsulatum DSM 1112]MDQ0324085.1 putative membrane protein [Pararhizobium capsulatum DSM 1112]